MNSSFTRNFFLNMISLRGFFLYALEIIENAQDYEILSTNLQPFVWRKVKNIIRQNKKAALQEFLFGKNEDEENISVNRGSSLSFEEMEKKIQNMLLATVKRR